MRKLEIELDFDREEPICDIGAGGRITLKIGPNLAVAEIRSRLDGALTVEEWQEVSALWGEDSCSGRTYRKTPQNTLIIARREAD